MNINYSNIMNSIQKGVCFLSTPLSLNCSPVSHIFQVISNVVYCSLSELAKLSGIHHGMTVQLSATREHPKPRRTADFS